MTIFTALEKIDSLTPYELKHCIQRMDVDLKYYEICVKNYPPERMIKHGIPYRKLLEERRKKFEDKLNEYRRIN